MSFLVNIFPKLDVFQEAQVLKKCPVFKGHLFQGPYSQSFITMHPVFPISMLVGPIFPGPLSDRSISRVLCSQDPNSKGCMVCSFPKNLKILRSYLPKTQFTVFKDPLYPWSYTHLMNFRGKFTLY